MHSNSSENASLKPKLRLEFKCPCGKFSISSTQQDGLFALTYRGDPDGVTELGRYHAINDAILAVLRQETGLKEWDRLPPEEIPRQVHDIASWQFTEIVELGP